MLKENTKTAAYFAAMLFFSVLTVKKNIFDMFDSILCSMNLTLATVFMFLAVRGVLGIFNKKENKGK